MVEEIEVKSALNKLNSKFLPYNWDLNIYRGCSHKCQYCYALYSHKYLERGSFYDTILVKKNIVEALEKKLSSKKWKREVINLGGVTDSYQAIEAKYKLMPEILKLLIKYKTPMTISTKSDLILRDIDLLTELAKVAWVNVAVTVTTMNTNLQQKIEPGAMNSERRLNALRQLKGKGIGTGIHFMPMLPYLTDTRENIEEVFKAAAKVKIDYAICGMLNLKSETKINYFDFIKKEFPELWEKYCDLYHGAFADKEYCRCVYRMVSELKQKYKINSDYAKFIPKTTEAKQLTLI